MLKKTNKLFFERFVDKVSVTTPLANQFRGRNMSITYKKLLKLLLELHDSKDYSISINPWRDTPRVTKQQIEDAIELTKLLDSIPVDSYTIRVEGSILGLYFNDASIINKIKQVKNISIREISTVNDDKTREYLLTTPKSIIRGEYTHKYKVTVSSLGNDCFNFINWAENLPKIKLNKNKKYVWGGFFYVADNKTLMLCKVFLGDKIRKIEELVSISEI
jgi:hypothetical protein